MRTVAAEQLALPKNKATGRQNGTVTVEFFSHLPERHGHPSHHQDHGYHESSLHHPGPVGHEHPLDEEEPPETGGPSEGGAFLGKPNWGRWKRWLAVAFLLGVALLGATRCVVFVDESEYVYVTLFGKPVRLLVEPGLHWKWPFETVRRLDRRLHVLNPPGREMLTKGGTRRVASQDGSVALDQGQSVAVSFEVGQNLNVEWFACWRLPTLAFVADMEGTDPAGPETRQKLQEAVLRYLRAVGSREAAEARLEDRIWSQVRAEVGELTLQDFVNLQEQKLRLSHLEQKVADAVRKSAYQQFGMELVDVRLRRFNHPAAVRSSIYEMIRTERQTVSDRTRAEGKSRAEAIRSQADKEVRELLALARREAATLRAQAEADAMRITNEAHAQDPTFYEFLVTLDTYKKILNEKTTLIVSTDSPLFKLLTTMNQLGSGHVLPHPPGENTGTSSGASWSDGQAPKERSRTAPAAEDKLP
jgi:membrane protease subunit HflC